MKKGNLDTLVFIEKFKGIFLELCLLYIFGKISDKILFGKGYIWVLSVWEITRNNIDINKRTSR